MCRRYCRDSLVITRNVESQEVLGKLGIPTELGTDTAWTFEPLGPEYARKALRDAGWDGATPVLAVCPINPFWWPVKPSLAKWIAHSAAGAYKKSHYRTIYFHRSGADVDAAYEKYLSAMADGVRKYGKDANGVPGAGRHGDARSRCLRADRGKARRRADFLLRPLQHVRNCEHSARRAIACFRRAFTPSSPPCPAECPRRA